MVIDKVMIVLDGIFNKGKLGVNVILGVFIVVVCVVVDYLEVFLYYYLGGFNMKVLLILMMNIINGGLYVDNLIDF